MVRSFSPCNTVIVCIWYSLICSLVTVHDHGAHVLTGWVMHEVMHHQLKKNGLCTFLVTCPSVVHVCLLHMTWSLMQDCSMCRVVCSSSGQP